MKIHVPRYLHKYIYIHTFADLCKVAVDWLCDIIGGFLVPDDEAKVLIIPSCPKGKGSLLQEVKEEGSLEEGSSEASEDSKGNLNKEVRLIDRFQFISYINQI